MKLRWRITQHRRAFSRREDDINGNRPMCHTASNEDDGMKSMMGMARKMRMRSERRCILSFLVPV